MLYFMAGPDAEAYGMTGVLTAVAHRKGHDGTEVRSPNRRFGQKSTVRRFDGRGDRSKHGQNTHPGSDGRIAPPQPITRPHEVNHG